MYSNTLYRCALGAHIVRIRCALYAHCMRTDIVFVLNLFCIRLDLPYIFFSSDLQSTNKLANSIKKSKHILCLHKMRSITLYISSLSILSQLFYLFHLLQRYKLLSLKNQPYLISYPKYHI